MRRPDSTVVFLLILGVIAAGLSLLVFIQNAPRQTADLGAIEAQQADTPDTALIVNGERIFPFGMYHVSWAAPSRADTRRALGNISAAGFNLMHPALDTSDGDFLDLASKLGVWLIVEVNDDNGSRAMYETFGNHPAILAWLTADDFNRPTAGHTPASVRQTFELARQLVPERYTYISGGVDQLSLYFDSTDIMGIQTYSIPSDPLDTTNRMLTQVIAERGSRSVSIIANIQTYAPPDKRAPTPLELRNMTYQALINHVDGILYYTYFDERWNIEEHPELWAALGDLAFELRLLTPILLEGKLTKETTDRPGVLAGRWRYGEDDYLVLINTTDETVEDLRIRAGGDAIRPMFPEQPVALTLTDGELTGDLAAQDVQVLVVN